MQREFEKTKEWNILMGNKVPAVFTLPSPDIRSLATTLMYEEADELEEATTKDEALDAVSDQLFVLFGNAAKYGLEYKEIFEYFKKVCKSNNSKFANTEEEAKRSIDKEALRLDISPSDIDYMELNGKYVIFNKETTKILKSVNYKEPTEY